MKHERVGRKTNKTSPLKTSLRASYLPDTETIKTPVSAFLAAWIICVAVVFLFKGRALNPDVWVNFSVLLPHIPNILADGLLWNSILCLAIWFVFYGLGDSILFRLNLPGMTRLEHAVVAVGLGSGAISIFLLLLGLAGLWSVLVIKSLFFAGIAASVGSIIYRRWYHRNASNDRCIDLPGAGNSLGILQLSALAIILLAVLMNVLSSAVPEIYYDSLTYHLALAYLYLLRGGIVPTPENLYSGIPFNVEMLYGLALAISKGGLPALLHCSFGLVAMLAIWVWMRRYASGSAGILALLLFYQCPPVLLGSWESGVDLAAGFYVIAAFIAFSFSLGSSASNKPGVWAALSGVLMGFACGVKYTLIPLALSFVFVHFWLRRREVKGISETILMGTALVLVFLPWPLKNIWFYGNPMYPFLGKLFHSPEPALFTAFLQDARSRDLAHTFLSIAGWKSFLAHPWDVTIGSRGTDDWLGAPLLVLAPWLFFLRWGIWRKLQNVPHSLTALAILGILGYSLWYLTSDIMRFLIPSLPLIVCAIALTVESTKFPSWLRRMAWIGAIIFSLFSIQAILRLGETWAMGRWAVLSGRQSAADYLASEHMSYGGPYYTAMEYINSNLPINAKVLFLGESRAFYCDRDYIASSVFDENPFWAAVRESKTADKLNSRVKAMGITHIFISFTRLYTYADMPTIMPRDLIGGKVFRDFIESYMAPVFNDRKQSGLGRTSLWLIVYKITDKGPKPPSSMQEPFRILLDSVARKK